MSMAYGDDDFMPEIPIEDLAQAAELSGIDLDSREGQDEVVGATITRWRDLPDGERPAAWDELRDFVEWIAGRYSIGSNEIPACWFRHASLVEELSALRAAWDASFSVETDGGLGPIGWHERFALSRQRMSAAYGGECSRRGGHQEETPVTLTVDTEEWETWKGTES